MTQAAGRPRASSRETLAEAACELFFERGYTATSVWDIAQRAGVSRSSFFNYFAGKSDVFWWSFDEQLERLEADLDAAPSVPAALTRLVTRITPDTLALALTNAEVMGAAAEIERDAQVRQGALAQMLAASLRQRGQAGLDADVVAAAYAAAVLVALREWARRGAARTNLPEVFREAIARLRRLED